MKPLALLGGTFDPVHLGHLCAAWEAAELLDAEVCLLPASVPPHRPSPVADAAQRVAILRAALADQSTLQLDTRELGRNGPSYTVDTLAELRREQPARSLVLLIGADAFAGLPGWHRWHELFELAHIGVLTRPGVSAQWAPTLAAACEGRWCDARSLHAAPAGRLVELEVTPLQISSTRIRDLLRGGRMPRYQLPAGVFADPALLQPYRVA